MVEILNWSSVTFAVLAAFFWFWSAVVRLPKTINSGYGGIGGTAQELGDKLRNQSFRSAVGAVCAAIAALCQAGAMAAPSFAAF